MREPNTVELSDQQKQAIDFLLGLNPNVTPSDLSIPVGAPEGAIQAYIDTRNANQAKRAGIQLVEENEPEEAVEVLPGINLSNYLKHSIFKTSFTKSYLFEAVAEATEGGAPKAIYEKRHENKKHRGKFNSTWIGKTGVDHKLLYDNLPKHQKPTRRTRSRRERNADAILEFIANSIYVLFGSAYLAPKLKLADLPLANEFLTENFWISYCQQEFDMKDCLHVMSKFMEEFTNLGEIKTRDPETNEPVYIMQQESDSPGFIEKYKRPPETVIDPETNSDIPLRGLMEILAVGTTIADTDVIGGGGKNAGITFRTSLGGIREAIAINIDPGYAFNFDGEENKLAQNRLEDPKDIQLGNNSPLVIEWKELTDIQRLQYLEAKRALLQVLDQEDILNKIFFREELIQVDYERYETLVEQHRDSFLSSHPIFMELRRVSNFCPNQQQRLTLDELFDETGELLEEIDVAYLVSQTLYIEFNVDGQVFYFKTYQSTLSADLLKELLSIHQAKIKNLSLLFDNKGGFVGNLSKLRRDCDFIKLYAKGKKELCDIRGLDLTKELLQELNIIHYAEYKFTPETAGYYRDLLRDYIHQQQEIFEPALEAYEDNREKHLFDFLIDDIDLYLKAQYARAGSIQRTLGNPLPIADCYTHVAIVKEAEQKEKEGELREKAEAASEKNQSQLGMLGNYEDIHAVKEEIAFDTLFDKRDGKSIERLLVLGRAGIGKSTFCQKIVHDWGGGELWDGLFDQVFWIRLREITPERFPEKTDQLPYTTAEIIQTLCFGDKVKLTSESLARLHKNFNILYLLDGYDETTHLDKPENAYLKAVLSNLMRESDYQLITSRPYERAELEHIADLELEITGFTPKDIDHFIENPLVLEDPEQQNSLKLFLKNNPGIKRQCQVPIQLDLITGIWATEGEAILSEGTFSMTCLYQKLTDQLALAYLSRQGVASDQVKRHHKDQIAMRVRALEEVAYEGMIARKVIIPYEVIRPAVGRNLSVRTLFEYGLLNPIGAEELERRSGVFIHLSYQEFLAAAYLVRQWQEGNASLLENFLDEFLYDNTYEMMLIFIAGQMETQEEAIALFERVSQNKRYWQKRQMKLLLMLNELNPEFMDAVNTEFVQFGVCKAWEVERGIATIARCQTLLERYPTFIHSLITSLKDRDGWVRRSAAEALGQFGRSDDVVIDALITSLKDWDYWVRESAAEALGQLGRSDDVVIDALITILQDSQVMQGKAGLQPRHWGNSVDRMIM